MITAILIGTLAGFLAGRILRGEGFGFLKNLGLGLVGSFVGHLLFGVLGFSATSLLGGIIASVAGAILLVLIFGRKGEHH